MTPTIDKSGIKFPSFYAECAYRDGARGQYYGDHSGVSSYLRHGEPEPIGMEWYNKGAQAVQLGLVRP